MEVSRRAVGGCSGVGLWSPMCSSWLCYGNGFLGVKDRRLGVVLRE